MSKARELLESVSRLSSYNATVSESAASAFSDVSIDIDILPDLLEDIARSSRSNIILDVKNEQLVLNLKTSTLSDTVSVVNDTQRLFEDLGFHLESMHESPSNIELTLRI